MSANPEPTSDDVPAAPAPSPAPPSPALRPKIRRMPLVPAALALMAGIVAGRFLPVPTAAWWLVAAAGLAAGIGTFLRPHLHLLTAALVAVTIAALGAVRVRVTCLAVPDDHIVTYTSRTRMLATLRGRVASSPHAWHDANVATYRTTPRMSFLLDAQAVRTERDGRVHWQPVSGLVRVRVDAPDYRLAPGMDVELMGWLARPAGPDNPGQYDWATAARNRGIFVQLGVRDAEAVTIRGPQRGPWYARLYWRVRAAARQHLADCDDAIGGQLLGALIIGERDPALRTLNEAFAQAGVAHFLSISGMHLGIFVGFVYLLCRACMLGRRRSALVVLALLAAYVLLAEPRAPLLRSAIMAASLCLAALWNRPYSVLNALAAAAVVLLAAGPMDLFDAGFQLSFGIVAGIVLLHHPVRGGLFGRWIRRRGLTVFRDDQRVRRWLTFRAADWLMDGVAMCIAAFVCAAPLTAWHFGRFSPYAPVLTFLMLPPMLLVLVPGYLSILLAWPMPNLSHAIGTAAARVAEWLAQGVTWTKHLPGLSFELRPVSIAWVVLCYGAIALVALRGRIRFGWAWAAGACLAVAAATAYTQRSAPPPDRAELHLLAIGDGQCAILRTPSGRTYVLDAGSLGPGDVGRDVLLPFLRHMRLSLPRAATVSHANVDHFNGLAALVAQGTPGRVYLNDYFGCEQPPSETAGKFLELLADRGVEVVRLHAGRGLQLDERTKIDVLWPPAVRRDDLSVNDTSLVLRITCDGVVAIVPGDASAATQAALLAQPRQLRCDVLVMPHHGGWQKTLPEFVRAADPRIVLVSNRQDPTGPAGKADAAHRFYTQLRTARRYCSTRRNGWIRVRFGQGKADVDTMR